MRRTGSVSVFWNTFIYQTVAILADNATSLLVLPRCLHFCLGFRFLLVHTTCFPYSPFLVDAGCSVGVTVSCDEDVREVGENEVEELVDRPGTTICTQFAVLLSIFLPLLMRYIVASSFVSTSPLAVSTVVGLLEVRYPIRQS